MARSKRHDTQTTTTYYYNSDRDRFTSCCELLSWCISRCIFIVSASSAENTRLLCVRLTLWLVQLKGHHPSTSQAHTWATQRSTYSLVETLRQLMRYWSTILCYGDFHAPSWVGECWWTTFWRCKALIRCTALHLKMRHVPNISHWVGKIQNWRSVCLQNT